MTKTLYKMTRSIIYVPEPLLWDPQPDITPYELAMCLPLLVAVGRQHQFYANLPEPAKRHWKEPGE